MLFTVPFQQFSFLYRTYEATTCFTASTLTSYLKWKNLFTMCVTFEALTKNPKVKIMLTGVQECLYNDSKNSFLHD